MASQKFTVSVGKLSYSSSAQFVMIRTGRVTHSTNTDQRRVPLTPLSGSGSGTYTLQVPADYGVALLGWYMLFALDGGVPSLAGWIRVALS